MKFNRFYLERSSNTKFVIGIHSISLNEIKCSKLKKYKYELKTIGLSLDCHIITLTF